MIGSSSARGTCEPLQCICCQSLDDDVGPFTITKVVSPVAFRLDLPLGCQIHPTFHASSLKAYIRRPEFEREVNPPPPALVDGNLEYEIEAILRHQGKGARRQYLVLWKEYDLSEATWEPESHLANAPDILVDCLCCVQTSEKSMQTKELLPSQRVPARIYHS